MNRLSRLVVHPVIVLLAVIPFVIAAIAAIVRYCRKYKD
jgi:hypothetical protein